MSSLLHDQIDEHARAAHAEIRIMAAMERDIINTSIGWYIRSMAQRRRYDKEKREANK